MKLGDYICKVLSIDSDVSVLIMGRLLIDFLLIQSWFTNNTNTKENSFTATMIKRFDTLILCLSHR